MRKSVASLLILSSVTLGGCSTSHSYRADKASVADNSDRNVQRTRPGEVDQTGFLPNASGVIGGKTGLTYAEAGVQNIFMFDDGGLWTKSGQDVVLKGLDITLDPAAREDGGPLFAGATRVQIAEASATASTVNPTLAALLEKGSPLYMQLSVDETARFKEQMATFGELGQAMIQALEAAATGGASTAVRGVTQ